MIALLYAAELVSPRIVEEHPCGGGRIAAAFDWVDHNARVVFAILATVLFTALVYNEASTRALTVAWAMEGVPLLVLGFALRERVLRLSGLALLGACVLKVFVYDLNNLETLARIVSFIVLGLLLLAVSFVYTRYYARLKRYL